MDKNLSSPTLHTAPMTLEAFNKRCDTTITWLGGAGFMVNYRGMIIFIDPLLSVKKGNQKTSEAGLELKIELPMKAEDVPIVDYVLYTHSDIDHLGPITAIEFTKKGARFFGTYRVYHQLTQIGVNPKKADVCRIGEEFSLGEITVEVTPADHPWQLKDLKRGGRPFRMGECCGFILNTPDGRIFFPGDTRLMEDHFKIKNIDVLALDVSLDEYHLNHVSATVLANHLSGAYLIPIHYGTYNSDFTAHLGDPKDVFKKISNGKQRGLLLQPGESFVVRGFTG